MKNLSNVKNHLLDVLVGHGLGRVVCEFAGLALFGNDEIE